MGKIKPSIEKITGDYQSGFRGGRYVIDNIIALKIINDKIWEYKVYNIYLLIFKKAL
jgi:hypothetical protein